MNVEYYFKKQIEKKIKKDKVRITGNPSLDIVKALLFKEIIIINLEANQWVGLEERSLLEELDKTITHEHTHLLIETEDKFTNQGEEKVCGLMANQRSRLMPQG